jgi:hypothetical protein
MPLYVDALKRHLPPYDGPDLTLYRGELESRHQRGIYGFAWSTKIECARCFALRSQDGGGVVVKTEAPAKIIICGPTAHSVRLDEHEYIVDPRAIASVEMVERESACG